MEYTLTPDEMKSLEGRYMAETAVPGALLMEHAAQGVVQALHRHAPQGGCVLFLCGPGNNGGDGYAAARLWHCAGGRSIIGEMSSTPSGDALLHRRLALHCSMEAFPLEKALQQLPHCTAVCDALFGTGLCRPIEGAAAEAIALVNDSGLPVVAVDIPSGLNGLTGHPVGTAVMRATETVTFHRLKQGLVLGNSTDYTGAITVHPILIPSDYGDLPGLQCMTPDDLPQLLPHRSPSAHKGSFGKAVLLVGSPGMAGAAALCAKACIRAGAGLTYVLCRASILPMVQVLVPGAVCVALPEACGRLAADAVAVAAPLLSSATCAAVGCGLGQEEALLPLLSLFREASCPVIWDADALNLLSRHPSLLPLAPHHIITPHPGEAGRLLATDAASVEQDRLSALHALHQRCGCAVLLKGARTLMTDGRSCAVNRFSTPALAKGGSGDVLTGLLCALLAQFPTMRSLEAMQLAALLHVQAGLRCAKHCGEASIAPEELADAIRLEAVRSSCSMGALR